MIHGISLSGDYWQLCNQLFFLFIFFYPMFQLGMLGAGDVKLFLLLGIFLSGRDLMEAVVYSFVVAVIFSVLKMAVNQTGIRETKIHMALSVFIGVLIVWGGRG